MMDILHFMFDSFWHFIGMMILLSIIGEIIIRVIAALRGSSVDDTGRDGDTK